MRKTLSPVTVWQQNRRFARRTWGRLSRRALFQLRDVTAKFKLSVARGEVQSLDGRWYVTHAGLLAIAERKSCAGIRTCVVGDLCDRTSGHWVFKAVVYKTARSKGFVGYGDADPSNTSPLVRGAEMRVAETRAVNRALRKAYGIGLCSVEELRYVRSTTDSRSENGNGCAPVNGNGLKGHSRLRDRLCLVIRQHRLDPALVKHYAADFCGTQELREASREAIESFITHVAEWAEKDRAALACKLNSYQPVQEVQR